MATETQPISTSGTEEEPAWVNNEEETGVEVISAAVIEQPKSKSGTTIMEWTPEDVADWLSNNGGDEYASAFKNQGVGGAALVELDEDALREIGIHHFGIRKRIAKAIRTLAVDARRVWRQEILWEGGEHRPPCCICLPYGFPFCCFCCVGYPATYRLTNSRLSLVVRDGCCRGLCAPVVITDNLELAFVTDLDTVTYTPLGAQCCSWLCPALKHAETGVLSLSSVDGTKVLHLTRKRAIELSGIITHAVEDAQLKFISQRAFWRSNLIL